MQITHRKQIIVNDYDEPRYMAVNSYDNSKSIVHRLLYGSGTIHAL